MENEKGRVRQEEEGERSMMKLDKVICVENLQQFAVTLEKMTKIFFKVKR